MMAGLTAVCMIAQQVGGKATRDALFLSSFDVAELPKVVAAGAVLSIAAVLLMGRALARTGPARLVPLAFLLSAGLFVVEWVAQAGAPGPVAIGLYLHMGVFGSIVISGFWSVVNERFDPHTAKLQIARVAAGATLGGVVGGVVADRVSHLFGVQHMLLVLAGINTVCAVGVYWVGRGTPPRVAAADEVSSSAIRILLKSAYLKNTATVVLLLAIMTALLDYALKATAQGQMQDPHELVSFFAIFYTVTGFGAFLVQTLLSRRLLQKIGLGGTIALLPITVILLSSVGIVAGRLWSVVLLRGMSAVMSNSLFRSGYELLFTPVPPKQKRSAKALIDVGFERFGDAVGSGLIMVLLMFAPAGPVQVVLIAALVAAVAALFVVNQLHRGYVAQLAASLRTGSVQLDSAEIVDATTRRTLAETTMALDRDKLLREIHELRDQRAAAVTLKEGEASDESATIEVAADAEATLERIADLNVADAQVVRQAIGRGAVDRRIVPYLITLLDQRPVRRDVERALRRAAPRHVGQLIDALLDSELPLRTRARLPRIIRLAADERAASGLMAGLRDLRFEVRYRCGRALAHLVHSHPELGFDKETVFAAALREVEVGRRVWESHRLLADEDGEEDEPNPLGEVLAERVNRSLEHVFTILSLTLDKDTLKLSLMALSSDDQNLRGTALEYLENILPDKIRKGLWPYVSEERRQKPKVRPRKEIVDDLLRSMDSLQIDRKQLLGKDTP